MSKKLTELVIDRSKWHRGQTSIGSKLLLNDGTMCCLGFHALHCGASKPAIRNVDSPESLLEKVSDKTRERYLKTSMRHLVTNEDNFNSSVCSDMMQVNDDTMLYDNEREGTLKKLFKKIGFKATFVN